MSARSARWRWARPSIGSAASVGADALVGSIEVGKYADIVIRKARAAEHLALDLALEFGAIAGSESIAAVIVNGRTVVQDGALLSAEEAVIVQRAQSSARRLLSEVMRSGRS
jgi:5-methylthioadenosine/S-adenosylhomocysteine deaminase